METYINAFTSQENWARKHNNGQRSAPVHWAIKVVILIFPVIFVFGVVAVIAIPAYHDYKQRAEMAKLRSMAEPTQVAPAAIDVAPSTSKGESSPTVSSAPSEQIVTNVPRPDTETPRSKSQVIESPALQSDHIQASFDCQKASSSIEKLICSTPESAEADKNMALAYAKASVLESDKDQLKTKQREWLKGVRNICGDTNCLITAYNDRIRELSR